MGWREYGKEIWIDSFKLWHRAERIAVFAGVVLGSLLLGIVLIGLSVALKPVVGSLVSAALLAWLAILVLVVSPFRLWR